MRYKGYRILANAQYTRFWDVDADGGITDEVVGVQYQTLDDGELWYSVVDKDHWCVMSFETIAECKEYIREIADE